MVAKNESSRCSLDDFLENNRVDIQIHSPEEVVFIREGKSFSLAKSEDLAQLKNQDFLLESPFMKKDADITKGFGCAYILDFEGKRTGYWLMNHGAETASGYKEWYQLEKSIDER